MASPNSLVALPGLLLDYGDFVQAVAADTMAMRVVVVNDGDAPHVMIPKAKWDDLQSQLNMMKADIERLKNEVAR